MQCANDDFTVVPSMQLSKQHSMYDALQDSTCYMYSGCNMAPYSITAKAVDVRTVPPSDYAPLTVTATTLLLYTVCFASTSQ
jgi:hypothetical protein